MEARGLISVIFYGYLRIAVKMGPGKLNILWNHEDELREWDIR